MALSGLDELHQKKSSSPLLEVVGPALLLGPVLGVVSGGVRLQLDLVGVDDFLAAVLALDKG